MNQQSSCIFYLVRHGESEWNAKGLLGGDTPLTDKGRTQAAQVSQKLKPLHFDIIYSSDLLRAKQTADILAQGRNISVIASPALRERSHGIFEGRKRDEVREQLREKFLLVHTLSEGEQRRFKFSPDMESEEEFVTRFTAFLTKIGKEQMGKTVLLVTHGNMMRYLLLHLAYASRETLPASSVKNTGLIKLSFDGEKFSVDDVSGVIPLSSVDFQDTERLQSLYI